MMSSAYFTVVGLRGTDAMLITRDCDASVKPVQLLASSGCAAVAASSGGVVAAAACGAAAGAPIAQSLRAIPPAAPSASPWLVQANMDHWLDAKKLDLQQSLPRTRLINQTLQAGMRAGAVAGDRLTTERRMWQLLSLPPIWDDETIYATISVPAEDRFITLVQCPFPQAKRDAASSKQPAKGARGRGRRRKAN
jgi:hypothetical protein